jgi:hypothetical protein
MGKGPKGRGAPKSSTNRGVGNLKKRKGGNVKPQQGKTSGVGGGKARIGRSSGGRGGGKGRGSGKGRGGSRPKPKTAEDLDREMDSYWGKSAEHAAKKLDGDMDDYWQKKDEPSTKDDEVTAAEPAEEVSVAK